MVPFGPGEGGAVRVAATAPRRSPVAGPNVVFASTPPNLVMMDPPTDMQRRSQSLCPGALAAAWLPLLARQAARNAAREAHNARRALLPGVMTGLLARRARHGEP